MGWPWGENRSKSSRGNSPNTSPNDGAGGLSLGGLRELREKYGITGANNSIAGNAGNNRLQLPGNGVKEQIAQLQNIGSLSGQQPL